MPQYSALCKRHRGFSATSGGRGLNDLPIVAIRSILPWLLPAIMLFALAGWPRRWRDLRGTTLLAPWLWTLLAIVSLLACLAVTSAQPDAPGSLHLRYLAGLTTLAPLVAVAGAKRPQDRAWQFIVAAMLLVAALPSLQQWFARPDAVLELHAVWLWFLLALVAVGSFNYLPTRYWPTALCCAAGQCCLLSPHLALIVTSASPSQWVIGAMLWLFGVGLMAWDLPRRRRPGRSLDRLWLDYRDLIGALWALRVAERINAASRQSGWQARLGWNGWTISGPTSPAFERSLRMLLRRFVSQAWIDHRLDSADANHQVGGN
jgi:hypothetical protein